MTQGWQVWRCQMPEDEKPRVPIPNEGARGGVSCLAADTQPLPHRNWTDHCADNRDEAHGRERQTPVSLKYQTKPIRLALKDAFGVNATGAALIADAVLSNVCLSYSRTAGHYDQWSGRYSDPLYTFRKVVPQVDMLDRMGLIHHDRRPPGQRGWQSAFQAKPELVDAFNRIIQGQKLLLAPPTETIWLRDRNTGNLIDYQDAQSTQRMRRRVEHLNEAISGASLAPSISASVVRIFTDDFDQNGRLYALGNSWQNIKSEARRQIEIAGEPVVELDFKSMHPALLYAKVGASPPSDCYAIDGFPRPLVKRGLLILINASDELSARRAIAYCDAMEDCLGNGNLQSAFRMAQELIEAIKRAHRRIAHTFHCDMGIHLMAEDGAIADEVVRTMLAKGIVVLPVHDSFLVAASKRAELEAAMSDAAQKVARVKLLFDAK